VLTKAALPAKVANIFKYDFCFESIKNQIICVKLQFCVSMLCRKNNDDIVKKYVFGAKSMELQALAAKVANIFKNIFLF
jgi:hypothetical protein